MKCQNCDEFKFTLIDKLANSVTGQMRCQSCGVRYKFSTLPSFAYRIFEGVLILFAIYFSFVGLNAWPLGPTLVVLLLIRILVLPRFAGQMPSRRLFRGKESLH